MRIENRRFGQLSLFLAGLGLSYYTAWVILLPFVEPEYQPLVARYFPSPAVGLALPLGVGAFIFVLLLCRAAFLVREDRLLELQDKQNN